MNLDILPVIVMLFAIGIGVVVIFRFLKLSPVLGYLVAGSIIGDHGFKIVTVAQTELLGELGVVFLLFAIGLELSFERLMAMRKYVLGLGSLQVVSTTLVISGCTFLYTNNINVAIIIGGALALSSTAIVLSVLEENNHSKAQVGRISLGILLQQDFVVIPLLVIIPILAHNTGMSIAYNIGVAFLKAFVTLIIMFVMGRMLLRPAFRLISSDNESANNEVFVAATLLLCIGSAWITESMGLSLGLGAFVAGVLVAETEFRASAEESIHPFKGLLLGLFFMSVGMNLDAQEAYKKLDTIITLSVCTIATKAFIIVMLCMIFGFTRGVALHTGLLLSQGGEFSFIVFNLAIDSGILNKDLGSILLLVVTCTMALTPLLSIIGSKLFEYFDKISSSSLKAINLNTSDLTNHVIIAGFKPVGLMVAKMLEARSVHYIAIDTNDDVVNQHKEQGYPIFKGDISNVETLKALGIQRALALIVTIKNHVTLTRIAKIVNANFPDTNLIIRANNLKSAHKLISDGVQNVVPQDCEMGLQIGGVLFQLIGFSDYEISRIKNQFRANNYSITKEYIKDES